MNKENILNKLEDGFIASVIHNLDLLGIKAELSNFQDGFGPYQDQYYFDFKTLNQASEFSIWMQPWYFDEHDKDSANEAHITVDVRNLEFQSEWSIELPDVSEGNEEDKNIECMTNVLNKAPQIAKEIKDFIGGCNE